MRCIPQNSTKFVVKVQSSVNFSLLDVRMLHLWNFRPKVNLVESRLRLLFNFAQQKLHTGEQRAYSPLKITYSSLSSWNNQVNYNYHGASLFFVLCFSHRNSLRTVLFVNLDMDNEDEFHNNLWALTDNWKQIYQSAWKVKLSKNNLIIIWS